LDFSFIKPKYVVKYMRHILSGIWPMIYKVLQDCHISNEAFVPWLFCWTCSICQFRWAFELSVTTSRKLYGSMKRQPALETPSRQRNPLIVDMNGRLEMSDL
jgi:hypothetical protein